MSKMWEVDPETRSKLQEIQKTKENNRCVDCGAPSPQWISPKFGIFFCLACSGIHRSLGVHISFVRSATMDALKTAEVKRMELGGNTPWKDFFNEHSSNALISRDFDSCTISERYDSDAGEEWKERLTAKVEGTEYIPGASKPTAVAAKPKPLPTGITPSPSGRNTPIEGNKLTPQRTTSHPQKERNEAYFAKMGAENASRPEDVPPSQGGKYAGFGSSPFPDSSTSTSSSTNGVPSADDFQRDPMAALTKGFGWLSSNLGKQAASVNKSYIQPGMKSFAEGDLAAQIRQTGISLGNSVQQGSKGLNEQFNRFVEGGENYRAGSVAAQQQRREGGGGPEKRDFWDSFGQDPAGPPQEKKDFWDDFAAAGEAASQQKATAATAKPSSIGTSAMKNTKPSAPGGKKDDDGWGDW